MEKLSSSNRLETKHENPSKFLLNHFNGLFKSNEEVTRFLTEGAEELSHYESQEIRKEQLRIYREFSKNVLGVGNEVIEEDDPFFQVTGVPIEKAYLSKHELNPKDSTEKHSIFVPTTLLLSGDYFLEQDRLQVRKDENEILLAVNSEKNFGTVDSKLGLFDPLVFNETRDWMMQFGFMAFEPDSEKNNVSFAEAIIVLEPGVLELVRHSREKENISQKLQEILTWFNHDLIAHGTFLPTVGLDEKILKAHDAEFARTFARLPFSEEGSTFNSAFAGELWSLSLHESVFRKFVEQRPSIVRFLRSHLDSYVRSVELAVEDIGDKEVAYDVKDYFLKAYSFGFFRLVNPKDFQNDDLFLELRNKYPNLSDLGLKEDNVRKFAFGEEGLLKNDKGTTSFVPHREVFNIFTDSFEKFEDFEKLSTKIGEVFYGRSSLEEGEKKQLRGVLGRLSPAELSEFLYNKVNLSVTDPEGKNIKFIEKHTNEAVNCLLEEGISFANYYNRLQRRVYGFMYSSFQKRDKKKEDGRREAGYNF